MIGLTALAMTLFISLFTAGTAMAGELVCSSHKNAPAYSRTNGQWRLKADIKSERTLADVDLKNMQQPRLGSTTERVSRNSKETGGRLFRVDDVFCKYELLLPIDFSKMTTFEAKMDMTCDGMYDANTTLYCVVR